MWYSTKEWYHAVHEELRVEAGVRVQGRLAQGDRRDLPEQRSPPQGARRHGRQLQDRRSAPPGPGARDRSPSHAGDRLPERDPVPEGAAPGRGAGTPGQGCHAAPDPEHPGSSLQDVI